MEAVGAVVGGDSSVNKMPTRGIWNRFNQAS